MSWGRAALAAAGVVAATATIAGAGYSVGHINGVADGWAESAAAPLPAPAPLPTAAPVIQPPPKPHLPVWRHRDLDDWAMVAVN